MAMSVGGRRRVMPPLAVERQKHKPAHVDRRQQRRKGAGRPEDAVSFGEGLEEQLVLAEEAGQEGEARQRERPDDERPVGQRQVLLQPAHVADVLFTRERVNHGTRHKEQERLEERMGIDMEDAGAIGADTHGHEHVAQL